MSSLIAAPELITTAATDLARLGSTLNAAHAAAAAPTMGVLAAAEDEVSAAVAALFSSHAQQFQQLGTQAAAFYDQFVQALNGSGGSYAVAEVTGVSLLQTLMQDLQGVVSTVAAELSSWEKALLGPLELPAPVTTTIQAVLDKTPIKDIVITKPIDTSSTKIFQ